MREKIIDTAIEEFTKHGSKFTMNDVAKELGISKKTIYTIFESKQDVLVGVSRLFEVARKYPKQYRYLMEAVNQGWILAEQYLERGVREGKIRKDISVPVVMAMIRGTVTCFTESDILYKNGLTYEQGKEEMVQIIMKGIRAA